MNDEAIKSLNTLKESINGVFDYNCRNQCTAIDMAIKALEQEPCEDCISREKAKQFLYERLDRLNDDELYDIFSTIIDDMYNELPSVTPATQWHKIEDKLPEINQFVLCRCKPGITEALKYTADGWYHDTEHCCMDDFVYCYRHDFVIAWTELPEWKYEK